MKWKEFSSTIALDAEAMQNSDSIVKMFDHKRKEAVLEMEHSLHGVRGMNFEEVNYRRYRRGKNRCFVCGLKLGSKEHAYFEALND